MWPKSPCLALSLQRAPSATAPPAVQLELELATVRFLRAAEPAPAPGEREPRGARALPPAGPTAAASDAPSPTLGAASSAGGLAERGGVWVVACQGSQAVAHAPVDLSALWERGHALLSVPVGAPLRPGCVRAQVR